MATLRATKTGTLNVQPRIAGDMALLRGVAKALLEAAETDPPRSTGTFLDELHERLRRVPRALRADAVGRARAAVGRRRGDDPQGRGDLRRAERTIVAWCLGITQQEHGVDTIREIVNLLLLRGNIGRAGAGPSPIRGHSNVQGNRTCGINHRPSGVPRPAGGGLRDRPAARAGPRHGAARSRRCAAAR